MDIVTPSAERRWARCDTAPMVISISTARSSALMHIALDSHSPAAAWENQAAAARLFGRTFSFVDEIFPLVL